MKVSVIITTYNQAGTIERAIDSVLKQEFSDYEILVINDGSTDNTSSVLKRYAKQVRIFNAEHNGMMYAYNVGFQSCRGEFIAICDGDDFWIDKLKLKKQIDYMDSHLDCGFCITKVYTKSKNGIGTMQDAKFINKQLTFDNLLIRNAYIHAQSYCIRKSVFDKYINFNKFMKFYTWDYPIVLELIRHTRFHCLDFYSAVFNKRTESVTQTKDKIKRFKQIYGQYKIKLYYILKYGCKFSTVLWLIYYLARRIYSLIFKTWS